MPWFFLPFESLGAPEFEEVEGVDAEASVAVLGVAFEDELRPPFGVFVAEAATSATSDAAAFEMRERAGSQVRVPFSRSYLKNAMTDGK